MEYFEAIPEDLVRKILMKTSSESPAILKTVCKNWKSVLENPKFYEERLRERGSKELICLLGNVGPLVNIYDPINKSWKTLPPVPSPFQFYSFSKCICVKQKLVLLGSYEHYKYTAGLKRKRPARNYRVILIFDFVSCKWRKGADILQEEDFACCASSHQGLIYVAGGRVNGEITSQAAVYNVERDEWRLLPNMIEKNWLCYSVFMENMMYVMRTYQQELQRFDPERGVWSTSPNIWFVEDCVERIVAAFGRLYCFQWDVVTEYDSVDNVWKIVDDLPEPLDRIDAAVFGDGIFLSGLQSGTNNAVFYIYQPPLETAKETETGMKLKRRRWVSVEKPPQLSHVDRIESVSTVTVIV